MIDIKQISKITGADVLPDFFDVKIKCASALNSGNDGAISFYNGGFEYLDDVKSTRIRACFIKKEHVDILPSSVIPMIVRDPYLAIAQTVNAMYGSGEKFPESFLDVALLKKSDARYANISERANISSDAKIGQNVTIMPGVYIGCGVVIGDNSVVHANASLEWCTVGKSCVIRSGARIGSSGFGFIPNSETGRHITIPQISSVILGNEVDIGANTCIDRGFLSDTQIGSYTKIDNMVHIGHGVTVGKSCFFAGGTVLAGSCAIGDFCMIGGNSSVANNVRLHDFTKVLGMSGIVRNTDQKGECIAGIPAINHITWKRMQMYLLNMVKRSTKAD